MLAPGADPITPVALSKGGIKWRVVKLVEDQIGISGGVGGPKPISTKIMKMEMGGTMWRFVQLDKNSEWFLKGTGGAGIAKGALKAVEVILTIRDKFNADDQPDEPDAAETAVAANSAVAGGDDDADEVDPMDALDVADDTPKKPAVAANTKTKTMKRSMVKELEMPERPPCSATGNKTTMIAVYQDGKQAKNASLWIRIDCIDWLLAYACDELFFQGVTSSDGGGTKTANCPAVADLHLEWNFTTKAWDAEFVAGTFMGIRRSFGTADLNAKRLQLMQTYGGAETIKSLSTSASILAKLRARTCIELWCNAIANERDDFETTWNLDAQAAPQPKRARALKDDAAVAGSDVAERRVRNRGGTQICLEASFAAESARAPECSV
jgi:hypothetical protein